MINFRYRIENIREIFLLVFISTKLETQNQFRLECKMESLGNGHQNIFGDFILKSSLWLWDTSHFSILYIIHGVVLQTVMLTWFQFSGVIEYVDEDSSAEKHIWTFKSPLVPHRSLLQNSIQFNSIVRRWEGRSFHRLTV